MCGLIVVKARRAGAKRQPSPEGLGYRWRMIPSAVGAALALRPQTDFATSDRGKARIAYAIPSFLCSCSSEIPFVSGYTNNTTKNCSVVIAAKNANGRPPEYFASTGNSSEMIAFIIQCEDEPRLWPLERTRLGNTSAIYTQITAPWETEKNPI